MIKTFFLAVLVSVVVVSGAETPTLTELQRAQIAALTARLENAQIRMELARRDFESVKTDLLVLARSLEREGYELDLSTGQYRQAKAKAP